MKMSGLALRLSLVCCAFSLLGFAGQATHQNKRVRSTAQVLELESEKIVALSKDYKGTPEQKAEILDAFKAHLKEKFPQSDKKILLKFGASWCVPCRQIAPEIEKFASNKAAEYEVIHIDLDSYKGLARALDLGGVPAIYDLLRGTETSLGDSEDRIGPITSVPNIIEYLNSK